MGSYNTSSQKKNKNQFESSKMSTTNTKKNSMINTSSVTNDKKKKGIADYYSSSFKNKIKASLTQKKYLLLTLK